MPVPSILQGQLWRSNKTGDNWLVTKVYSEVFATYAVIRKVGKTDADPRRVKVEKHDDGVELPGYTFTQESDSF